jgi:hypothetical protein
LGRDRLAATPSRDAARRVDRRSSGRAGTPSPLGREPHLKRYFVASPYDLPAGDTEGARARKSAHTKWLEKKAEWEALATERGMSVEFVYLGAHALLGELIRPQHAGRVRYWFDTSVLSPDDLRRRLADVVSKAVDDH